MRTIEDVIRRVRHPTFLADSHPESNRRQAADGVHTLHIAYIAECARPGSRDRSQKEPWNRCYIRRATLHSLFNDHAATFGLPGRSRGRAKMNPEFCVMIRIGKKSRLRSN